MDKIKDSTIDNYRQLMAAVIEQAVVDYKDILYGFIKDGEKATGSNDRLYLAKQESFFRSDWYSYLATHIDLHLTGDELIEQCKKITKGVYARFRIAQDDAGKYYVYYYSKNFPASKYRYTSIYKAYGEAAELMNIPRSFYVKLLERDNRIFGKEAKWKDMIDSRKN